MVKLFSSALILLAAGSYKPNRLAGRRSPNEVEPFLRRAVEAAVDSGATPVVVVLGSNALEVSPALRGLPVTMVMNANWSGDMASSLRTGMRAVARQAPDTDGVILALADPPGLASRHIAHLLTAYHRTGRSIVASLCGGALLPPAFFARRHFPALRASPAGAGSRPLLRIDAAEVAAVRADDLIDAELAAAADYFEFLHHHH